MKFLRYLGYVPKLVGLIMVGVDTIEMMKEGELGEVKKKALLDSMAESWSIFQTELRIKESFDVFLPVLSVLIDFVVSILNVIGYFRHGENKS